MLKELPNTVVYLKSQEEYDEYMEMCEDVGWVWNIGTKPTESNDFKDKNTICIRVVNYFTYGSIQHYEGGGYNIITLNKLKEICGMWEPKQGEEVLVRTGINVSWNKRKFVVKYNGLYYCEHLNKRKSLMWWKECKPLKKHTITIDGKDIELSEDSFNALKEQLCD